MDKRYCITKCIGRKHVFVSRIHKDGTPVFTDDNNGAIIFEDRKQAEVVKDKLNRDFDGGWVCKICRRKKDCVLKGSQPE